MTEFVTLTCPSCGGKLQITNDIERFACGYCGNEHIVRRGGGVVSLAPVVEGLQRVQVGVDKTASELAIKRLRSEISELEHSIRQRVEAFANRYHYALKPGPIPYAESLSIMHRKLTSYQKGLKGIFAQAEAERLRKFVADFEMLVKELEDKQAQLRKHERIVAE